MPKQRQERDNGHPVETAPVAARPPTKKSRTIRRPFYFETDAGTIELVVKAPEGVIRSGELQFSCTQDSFRMVIGAEGSLAAVHAPEDPDIIRFPRDLPDPRTASLSEVLAASGQPVVLVKPPDDSVGGFLDQVERNLIAKEFEEDDSEPHEVDVH